MAITTLDQVIASRKPPNYFSKAAFASASAGRPYSTFYQAGYPGAAAAPAPGLAGAALTTYNGQIPFPAAVGGQSVYLDRFSGMASGSGGTLLLCDRLWHNSGLNMTIATAQTINSVAWPARDINASTNGVGVYLGLEVVTATGAGTPTLTANYTDSDGGAGITGTNIDTTAATSIAGSFYRIGLAAGDYGVRSLQTFTLSATWTSGSVSLVAYRVLAALEISAASVPNAIDAVTGSLPLAHDGTVPFVIWIPQTTTASSVSGIVTFAQG